MLYKIDDDMYSCNELIHLECEVIWNILENIDILEFVDDYEEFISGKSELEKIILENI